MVTQAWFNLSQINVALELNFSLHKKSYAALLLFCELLKVFFFTLANKFFFLFLKNNIKLTKVRSKFNKDNNKIKFSHSFLTFENAILTNAACVTTPGYPELRLAYNDLL